LGPIHRLPLSRGHWMRPFGPRNRTRPFGRCGYGKQRHGGICTASNLWHQEQIKKKKRYQKGGHIVTNQSSPTRRCQQFRGAALVVWLGSPSNSVRMAGVSCTAWLGVLLGQQISIIIASGQPPREVTYLLNSNVGDPGPYTNAEYENAGIL